MKLLFILILSLISTSAFSAEWSQLQRHTESYFQGLTEFPFVISKEPFRTGRFKLYYAVTRVELSQFENPGRQLSAMGSDLAQTFGLSSVDSDYVEMHAYTESREINCSVKFENANPVRFENCRTRELDYGSWQTLQPN